jgi:ectoine hydroxylase-related dioxygenase (phytanoyl-CoA dioxygenase family)
VQNAEIYGGVERLKNLDEHNTIRLPLALDREFLNLARNDKILAICEALLGPYFILNQQNGIINPPKRERYNQGSFHRDLPYQHFVSSRPIAVNALFCLDEFTLNNGATLAIVASHKQEAFPSDQVIRRHAVQITAPRGSFIVLDCMLFHSGGVNETNTPRRAVNHVYSIPLLRQQIDLPAALAGLYSDDPDAAKLLGYGVDTPRSVADYYLTREKAKAT